MKKQLNETAIANELKGNSAFFRRPSSQPDDVAPNHYAAIPENPPVSAPVLPVERLEQHHSPSSPSELSHRPLPEPTISVLQNRSNERTNETTNVRTNERTKIRHTFDIYADQLRSLREIALQREALFGKRTLLGDLVQEALDMFLTKERNKE